MDPVYILAIFVIWAESTMLALLIPIWLYLRKLKRNKLIGGILLAGQGDDAAQTQTQTFIAGVVMKCLQAGTTPQTPPRSPETITITHKYKFPSPPEITEEADENADTPPA